MADKHAHMKGGHLGKRNPYAEQLEASARKYLEEKKRVAAEKNRSVEVPHWYRGTSPPKKATVWYLRDKNKK